MSIEEIRALFETTVKGSKRLASTTPLGTMEINGEFHHYMDPDTDTMWIGFALGVRTVEQLKTKTP